MPRYLIIIICFVVTAVLGIALVLPRYQVLQGLQPQIKKKQTDLDNQEAYFATLEKTAEDFAKHKGAVDKINASFPSEPDIPELFSYFQRVSAQNGLVLKTISSPSISASADITGKEIKFALSLSGPYSALKNFLSTLYKSARFIEAESLSFSSTARAGEIFDFNVRVKMYSY